MAVDFDLPLISERLQGFFLNIICGKLTNNYKAPQNGNKWLHVDKIDFVA